VYNSPNRFGSTTGRRAEILEVAAELFAERGFKGVTVDDIGNAIGVSGPALYYHFESKEAVLGELLVGISNYLLEGGRARRDSSRSDRLLADLIDFHVEFAIEHGALIKVHYRDLSFARADDQRRVRLLQRQYADIWVRALVDGMPGLTLETARPAVHAVFGLINSTPFSMGTRDADLPELLVTMAQGALDGLGLSLGFRVAGQQVGAEAGASVGQFDRDDQGDREGELGEASLDGSVGAATELP
jgi:AcrR family transcriptional regulator